MRFSLRALVIVTLVAPPLLAAIWFWGLDVLFALAMIFVFQFEIAPLVLLLALPLAIAFGLAALFWLVQKAILWTVRQVFDERPRLIH